MNYQHVRFFIRID